MEGNYPDSISLLGEVKKNDLYKALVFQLEKDFLSANVPLKLEEGIHPQKLINQLHINIYELLKNDFNGYLNLLYIIDVSEKKVKELKTDDPVVITKYITFIILKREWQKVWYRNKYS